jgi:5-methylthioadenosine/S-adenosylhomocysteine deaminase
MKTVLKNCKYIVTQNSKRQILSNSDILISGNKIQQIGNNLKGDKEIDCSQNIVMPGLINLHTHAAMNLFRGIADDMLLDKWLGKIQPLERVMTKDQIYVSSTMAIQEMLATGTTCFNDQYFGTIKTADAVKELGIRAVLSRGLGDSDPTQSITQKFAEAEKILKYIRSLKCSRIGFTIGPHAIYSCSKPTLLKAQRFGRKHKVLVHTHVAETRKELADSLKNYGKRPIEYLESIGFLDKNVIAAHCCWITKSEIRTLAKRGVSVAHCPRSNMKLASGGIMPLKEFQESGVLVGLGTDSAVSSNNLDMFEEMRTCALVQKHNYWDATVAPAQTVLDMATINGAKALRINTGSIETGKLADLVLLDAKHFLLQPLEKDRIISHLIYSANGSCVQKVFVDGQQVV